MPADLPEQVECALGQINWHSCPRESQACSNENVEEVGKQNHIEVFL